MAEYLKVFTDAVERFQKLSDAEFGRLMRAALIYKRSGDVIELSGREDLMWDGLKIDIDRDNERLKTVSTSRAEAGRKGAAKRWQSDGKNSKCHLPYGKNGYNKDKDKDKDKDRDDDGDMRARAISHIVEEYEQNIGVVPRVVGDDIAWWLDESMQEELIVLCIREAAARNARSWQYIRTMLQNCMSKGVMTAAAYEGHRRKKAANSNPFMAMIGGDGNDA